VPFASSPWKILSPRATFSGATPGGGVMPGGRNAQPRVTAGSTHEWIDNSQPLVEQLIVLEVFRIQRFTSCKQCRGDD
jgi:hypothetical protein